MRDLLLRLGLLGCTHQKTTLPFTSRRAPGRTYVVCLGCGAEFDYDWKTMRKGPPRLPRAAQRETTPRQVPELGRRSPA